MQSWHQHENLVMLLNECCKSLSRVNPHSRDNSNMHRQGGHHNFGGALHILKLPRRNQDGGISFHVLQCFALNKSTSGISSCKALEMGPHLSSWIDNHQELLLLLLLGRSWYRSCHTSCKAFFFLLLSEADRVGLGLQHCWQSS